MPVPVTTRLRYVASRDPQTIVDYCDSLGHRIQIYQIQFDGKKWFLWFVPPDNSDLDVKQVGIID